MVAVNKVTEKLKTKIASIKRSNENCGLGGGGGQGEDQLNGRQQCPFNPKGYCWTHGFASHVTTIVKPVQPGKLVTKWK